MDSNKLLTTFLNDSEAFIERLNALFLQLEREPENKDLMEQAFRWAHSLKSESSYMDYDGLTLTAGRLEAGLEELRKGIKVVDPPLLDHLFSLLDQWQQRFEIVKKGTRTEVGESAITAAHVPDGRGGWEEEFTDLEKTLLTEAKERGELLYRAVCEIDPETALKYAKAYLLINNLELLVNLIRIDPPLPRLKGEDFDRITFLFSSSVGEAEIHQALNVDQVSRIHLRLLRYHQVGELRKAADLVSSGPSEDSAAENPSVAEKPVESEVTAEIQPAAGPDEERGPLKVAASKVDQLMAYMDEMRLKLHGLSEKAQNGRVNPDEAKDLEQIRTLMGGMESALKEMRMAPLGESLGALPRLVRDLSRNAGKESRLVITGGDIRTDKRISDLLIEPLTHLIRNALDHGIETPDERLKAGKDSEGEITLDIKGEDDLLVLKISDDGRGIKREDVLAEAVRQGLEVDQNLDTLHYLTQPGFSTRTEVTPLSGRGLGLDLISRRITKEAGGTLSMETREGEGTSFIIKIPQGYQPRGLLLFKSAGTIYVLPSGTWVGVDTLEETRISRDERGGLNHAGLPLYTIQGRCLAGSDYPTGGKVLTLSHLGRNSCLLADEVLFEQEVSPRQINLGKELQPSVYELYIGEEKKDFLYLDPSFQV